MKNWGDRKIRLEQTTMGSPSVGAGGHIDIAYGTFDRPGPNPEKDMEKAVVPTEMVATQLATERPPVEDEDYVPGSIAELARASAEIAKLVPPDQVKKFYLRLKELADESIERQEITTMDEKNMEESKMRRRLVKMIREAMDDLDEPAIPGVDPNRELVSYPDIIKAHPEEFEDVKPARKYAAARMADKTGRGKLMAMLDQIPEEELDKIHDLAKDEYIDLLQEVLGDDLDANDIKDLKSVPAMELYEMSDSYKFFFKAAFVLPAADEFQKAFSKIDRDLIGEIEKKLKVLKLPQSIMSSVTFQLVGGVEKSTKEIKNKIAQAAAAGEIQPREIDMVYKRLMTKFPELEDYAKKKKVELRGEATKNYMDASMKKYAAMPLEQRKQIIVQALSKMGA